MQFIKNFIREEEGQDVVEYALVIGLVAPRGNRHSQSGWRSPHEPSTSTSSLTLSSGIVITGMGSRPGV